MAILNVEIKAACADPEHVRALLRKQDARFVGRDHQIDTYYVVDEGRLKLREGDIENSLIHYRRPNLAGPKRSDVQLFRTTRDSGMKSVLESFLDVLVVVDKLREIYFVDNVKFHIDEVSGLGSFVEIEAIDENSSRNQDDLMRQCEHFLELLDISEEQLLTNSYSDMILENSV